MAGDSGKHVENEERVSGERELYERMQDELRRIRVGDYLGQLLVTLSSMAFQRLGLTPETTADRDLDQARLAVDSFAAVVEVWAPTRNAEEAAVFRATLHQMRMAFVAASAGPATTATPGPTRVEAPGPATAVPAPEAAGPAPAGPAAPEAAASATAEAADLAPAGPAATDSATIDDANPGDASPEEA